TLLARRLGFRDRDAFAQALAATRQSVSAIFATLGAPESPPSPTTVALLDPSSTREELVAALGALAFRNAEASADELQLLRQKPHSPFAPAADDVARVLLEEAAASPDPDLALRRLVDLIGRRGAGATIWRLVAAHRP